MIIGIAGRAGSGKSTAAAYLMQRHGFVRGRFAGALKEMMRALLRYRGVDEVEIQMMIDGDWKELPSPYLNGKSPRQAMQTLGTEWGRDLVHPDLWVDTEFEHLGKASYHRNLVFDDVRFPNEDAAIRRAGGFMLFIERPGLEAVAGHTSEQFVSPAYYHVVNDSTVDALFRRIDEVLSLRSEAHP